MTKENVALKVELNRLQVAIGEAAEWFDTISSRDGKGHADLARWMLNKIERKPRECYCCRQVASELHDLKKRYLDRNEYVNRMHEAILWARKCGDSTLQYHLDETLKEGQFFERT